MRHEQGAQGGGQRGDAARKDVAAGERQLVDSVADYPSLRFLE